MKPNAPAIITQLSVSASLVSQARRLMRDVSLQVASESRVYAYRSMQVAQELSAISKRISQLAGEAKKEG